MNPLALEKLERIARNLPALKINFGRAATKYGDVFMAWGRNVDAWHAVYGTDLHGGLARGPIEIKPETREEDVQQILLDMGRLDLKSSRDKEMKAALRAENG